MKLVGLKYRLVWLFVLVACVACAVRGVMMLATTRNEYSNVFTLLVADAQDCVAFADEIAAHLTRIGFTDGPAPLEIARREKGTERWFVRDGVFVRIWYRDRLISADVFVRVHSSRLRGDIPSDAEIEAVRSELQRLHKARLPL